MLRSHHRQSLEIDIVARLAGGGILSGAVKWNQTPIDAEVHWGHLDMLRRAAEAGRKWAHQAREREASILYVAAGGFTDAFLEAAREADHPVSCWSLEELYAA